MNDFDTIHTEEIKCPYCGCEFSDSWEYHDYHEKITCYQCKKKFNFEAHFDVTYSTYKIKENAYE